MKIAFLVNDIKTEQPGYTTIRLMLSAINAGHEAWIFGVGDLTYDVNESIYARARSSQTRHKDSATLLKHLNSSKSIQERICVGDLDILLLRNNPADDVERPWAQTIGVQFGQMATRSGVIVLNDPDGLARAVNKMYFQSFPEEVRPRSLISRHCSEIRQFALSEEGNTIIKPLQGSGGKGVFFLKKSDLSNLNQIVESVGRDGYLIAQEYLPKAHDGDVRLFLMNGSPLRHKGKYAAFRRRRVGEDIRSNVHAGGKIEHAEITDEILHVAEVVRPKLVEDGMFLVGLDIVGNKLMEINVFSPGGLGSAQKFEKVNFCNVVISALDRKVQYMHYYRRQFCNNEMATL